MNDETSKKVLVIGDRQPTPFDPSKTPLCPHCGAELLGCAVFMWRPNDQSVVVCIYCPSCRTGLDFSYFPIAGMMPAEPPRIARPS